VNQSPHFLREVLPLYFRRFPVGRHSFNLCARVRPSSYSPANRSFLPPLSSVRPPVRPSSTRIEPLLVDPSNSNCNTRRPSLALHRSVRTRHNSATGMAPKLKRGKKRARAERRPAAAAAAAGPDPRIATAEEWDYASVYDLKCLLERRGLDYREGSKAELIRRLIVGRVAPDGTIVPEDDDDSDADSDADSGAESDDDKKDVKQPAQKHVKPPVKVDLSGLGDDDGSDAKSKSRAKQAAPSQSAAASSDPRSSEIDRNFASMSPRSRSRVLMRAAMLGDSLAGGSGASSSSAAGWVPGLNSRGDDADASFFAQNDDVKAYAGIIPAKHVKAATSGAYVDLRYFLHAQRPTILHAPLTTAEYQQLRAVQHPSLSRIITNQFAPATDARNDSLRIVMGGAESRHLQFVPSGDATPLRARTIDSFEDFDEAWHVYTNVVCSSIMRADLRPMFDLYRYELSIVSRDLGFSAAMLLDATWRQSQVGFKPLSLAHAGGLLSQTISSAAAARAFASAAAAASSSSSSGSAMASSGSGSSADKSKQSPNGRKIDEICDNFNSGVCKMGNNCRRTHRCSQCNSAKHPRIACTSARSAGAQTGSSAVAAVPAAVSGGSGSASGNGQPPASKAGRSLSVTRKNNKSGQKT
jgi:hypothetical protein